MSVENRADEAAAAAVVVVVVVVVDFTLQGQCEATY
jgi:hypothetical protein